MADRFDALGRRRALDRAMDEAIRKPGKRRSRKQDGIVWNTGEPISCTLTNRLPRISKPWPMLKSKICESA
jgi:hypothetical protein